MADTVSITAGSGTVIGTDEVTIGGTAQHLQRIKLYDGTNGGTGAAAVTTAGALKVDLVAHTANSVAVKVDGSAVTQPVSGTVTANAGSGTFTVDSELPAAAALADNAATPTAPAVGAFGMLYDGSTWDLARGDATNGALVNLGSNNDVSVSGTVTVDSELPAAAALADNTANPTVPAVGAFPHWYDGSTWDRALGNATDGLLVNLGSNNDVTQGTASNLKVEPAGNIAHDSADSGNPIKIGAKAVSALAGATLVAANDRTDLHGDLDGALLGGRMVPLGDIKTERISDTSGSSTAFSTFSAVSLTRNYVTAIAVYNANTITSGYVDLRDGPGGSILWTMPAPKGGGSILAFDPPLRQPTTNTALAYDVSGAISTLYVSVNGFQSKL